MTSVGDLSVGLKLGGLSSFISGIGSAGGAIGKVGAVAAAVSATVAIKSVKAFAQLESSMVRVKAISNATDKQFSQMNETVKRLGATTTFTANEAAEGLQFLTMAGLDTATAIDALPGALQLAQAAAVDLGTAADTVTNVMAGYGIAAKDLTRANDTLVATFTGSNTTLTELGEAFKVVGPVAKGMGVAFEDVAVAAGTLGNAGIKASDAGTGLKRALTAIVNASPKARKAMADLGLSSADAGKGFIHVVKKMELAKASMTDLRFQSRVFQLFGERAGPKMAALVEQGSAAMEKLRRKIEEAEGATKRIQDMELNTLAAKWKLLGSAVDGVLVAIGEDTESAVTKGVSALTRYVATIEHAVRKLGVLDAVGVALTGAPINSGTSRAIKEKTQGFVEQAEINGVREEVKRLKALIEEEKLLGPSQIYADGRTSIDGMMAEVKKQEAWLREKGQQKAPENALDKLITKTKLLIEVEDKRHEKAMARARVAAAAADSLTKLDTYTPATLEMERKRFEHDLMFPGGNRYTSESASDPFASGSSINKFLELSKQLENATSSVEAFTKEIKVAPSEFFSDGVPSDVYSGRLGGGLMGGLQDTFGFGPEVHGKMLGFLDKASDATGINIEGALSNIGPLLSGAVVGAFAGVGGLVAGAVSTGFQFFAGAFERTEAKKGIDAAFEQAEKRVAEALEPFAMEFLEAANFFADIMGTFKPLIESLTESTKIGEALALALSLASFSVTGFAIAVTEVAYGVEDMGRAIGAFVRWVGSGFTADTSFEGTDRSGNDFLYDMLAEQNELMSTVMTGLDRSVRDNTEATDRLTEEFRNITDSPGFRQARFEAEGARNRVDFGTDYVERARILNGGTLAVPGIYSQFNRPN